MVVFLPPPQHTPAQANPSDLETGLAQGASQAGQVAAALQKQANGDSVAEETALELPEIVLPSVLAVELLPSEEDANKVAPSRSLDLRGVANRSVGPPRGRIQICRDL